MSHRWIVHRIERGIAVLRDGSGSAVASLSSELLPDHTVEGDEYEVVASVRRDRDGGRGATAPARRGAVRTLQIA